VLRYWRIPEPAAFSSDRPALQNPILKVPARHSLPLSPNPPPICWDPIGTSGGGENPALLVSNSLDSVSCQTLDLDGSDGSGVEPTLDRTGRLLCLSRIRTPGASVNRGLYGGSTVDGTIMGPWTRQL
jgi:hypothetical protein